MVVRRFAAVAVVSDDAAVAATVAAAVAKTVIVFAGYCRLKRISECILRVSHKFSQHTLPATNFT